MRPPLLLALWLLGATDLGSAAERPNILFAIADDWGAHAGVYGTRWIRTPAFDRVAREGLLFNHAYTPNAKCAPSRSCLLTGRNPWQLGPAANHIPYFPPEFKTWAEALAEHGWFVGFTQKGWGPGIATNALGQPRSMTGRRFDARTAPPPTTGISGNDYAGNFEDFLAAAPPNRPWCFWYGAVEPHRDYQFGTGIALGGKKLTDIDRVPGYWPDNDTVRTDLLDYAFEVEHFDRHLGRMLDSLERRGALSNTLVVVTSDHGMPFPRVKGQVYAFANRVPLAMRWPAAIARPGRTIEDFVSFIDLAPTFVELAGLPWAATGMAESPGRSLIEIFRSTQDGWISSARDHVLIGRERQDVGRPGDQGYPVRGIVTADALFLRNFEPDRWPTGNPETGYLDCDGSPTKGFILEAHRADPDDRPWQLCFGKRGSDELYRLRPDPDCLTNVAAAPDAVAIRTALQTRLHAELAAQGDPRMSGSGELFDRYEQANPKQVGFHANYLRGVRPDSNWVDAGDFETLPIGTRFELQGRPFTLTRHETLPCVESEYRPRFRFDRYDNPKLAELRRRHRLDEVIAPGRDEFEKQVLLLDWTHRQFKRFGRPSTGAHGAIEILDAVQEGHAFFCAQYAEVLVSAAASLGWIDRPLALRRHQGVARVGGSTEHSVTEIWSNQHRKWVMFDPTGNFYVEKDGVPLNAVEIRTEWFYRNGTNLVLVVGKDRRRYRKSELPVKLDHFEGFGDLTIEPDELDKYGFIGFIPNTDLLNSGYDYGGMFIVKDALCDGTAWHVRSVPTKPAIDPYFPVGQTSLHLGLEAGQLRIRLRTFTPNLDRIETRHDEGGWTVSPPDFAWPLHGGTNRLETRTVNRFGVAGPISWAEVVSIPTR